VVSSTWLDIAVLVLVAVFAVAGWGRGLLRTLIWGAGVIAGALVGLIFFPQIAERIFDNQLLTAAISFSGVVGGAVMGGVGASVISKLIRPVVLPLGFLRLIDHIAGAIVGGAAMAIVIWLVASSVVVSWVEQLSPLPGNTVVVFVEDYVPKQIRDGLIVVIDRFGLPVEIEEAPELVEVTEPTS
jgi:uncharacterized membrane protein required for colicin V production